MAKEKNKKMFSWAFTLNNKLKNSLNQERSFMKIRNLSLIVFILFLLNSSLFSVSLSNVYGTIIDSETKEPVESAIITVNFEDEHGRPLRTLSDEKGKFEFIEFPVLDFEYEIQVQEPFNQYDSPYYKQRIPVKFYLEKGKNTYLKPIELKRGVKIQGNVRLWDGSIINKARIDFKLKNKEDLNSYVFFWQGTTIDENGHYISPCIPPDVDLILTADLLRSIQGMIGYGPIVEQIYIKKDNNFSEYNIIIQKIDTEIVGQIVNRSGEPISDQSVGLENIGAEVKTDSTGSFSFKHIMPCKTKIYVMSKITNFDFLSTNDIVINTGERILVKIIVDYSGYFKHEISKEKYQDDN